MQLNARQVPPTDKQALIESNAQRRRANHNAAAVVATAKQQAKQHQQQQQQQQQLDANSNLHQQQQNQQLQLAANLPTVVEQRPSNSPPATNALASSAANQSTRVSFFLKTSIFTRKVTVDIDKLALGVVKRLALGFVDELFFATENSALAASNAMQCARKLPHTSVHERDKLAERLVLRKYSPIDESFVHFNSVLDIERDSYICIELSERQAKSSSSSSGSCSSSINSAATFINAASAAAGAAPSITKQQAFVSQKQHQQQQQKQLQLDKVPLAHSFKLESYLKPTRCDSCKSLLIGLRHQGFACVKCKQNFCSKCKARADNSGDACLSDFHFVGDEQASTSGACHSVNSKQKQQTVNAINVARKQSNSHSSTSTSTSSSSSMSSSALQMRKQQSECASTSLLLGDNTVNEHATSNALTQTYKRRSSNLLNFNFAPFVRNSSSSSSSNASTTTTTATTTTTSNSAIKTIATSAILNDNQIQTKNQTVSIQFKHTTDDDESNNNSRNNNECINQNEISNLMLHAQLATSQFSQEISERCQQAKKQQPSKRLSNSFNNLFDEPAPEMQRTSNSNSDTSGNKSPSLRRQQFVVSGCVHHSPLFVQRSNTASQSSSHNSALDLRTVGDLSSLTATTTATLLIDNDKQLQQQQAGNNNNNNNSINNNQGGVDAPLLACHLRRQFDEHQLEAQQQQQFNNNSSSSTAEAAQDINCVVCERPLTITTETSGKVLFRCKACKSVLHAQCRAFIANDCSIRIAASAKRFDKMQRIKSTDDKQQNKTNQQQQQQQSAASNNNNNNSDSTTQQQTNNSSIRLHRLAPSVKRQTTRRASNDCSQPCIVEGWLKCNTRDKHSQIDSDCKRYWRLANSNITIFDSESSRRYLRQIPMSKVQRVLSLNSTNDYESIINCRQNDNNKNDDDAKSWFILELSTGSTYFVHAECESDAKKWRLALSSAVALQQQQQQQTNNDLIVAQPTSNVLNFKRASIEKSQFNFRSIQSRQQPKQQLNKPQRRITIKLNKRFVMDHLIAGKYLIEPNRATQRGFEELGSGQFGKVFAAISEYRVEDTSRGLYSGIPVAIKEILKARFDLNQQAKLKNEACILSRLEHPGVIRLHRVHELDDKIYIVMEQLEDDMLEMIVSTEEKRLCERVAKFLTFQILEALKYLHSQCIAHCDLKPENVLLVERSLQFPQIKLCDFGFAKIIEENAFRCSLVGTPAYLAPEVVRGERYNRSVDLWSVGVIVYVSLSGEFPFNEGENIHDQISRASFMYPTKPWAKVSRIAKAFIDSLLKVRSEQRLSASKAQMNEWFQDYQLWCDLVELEARVGRRWMTDDADFERWFKFARTMGLQVPRAALQLYKSDA